MSQQYYQNLSKTKSPDVPYQKCQYSPLIYNKINVFLNSNKDIHNLNFKSKLKNSTDNLIDYQNKENNFDSIYKISPKVFKDIINSIDLESSEIVAENMHENKTTPFNKQANKIFDFSFKKEEFKSFGSSILHTAKKIDFDNKTNKIILTEKSIDQINGNHDPENSEIIKKKKKVQKQKIEVIEVFSNDSISNISQESDESFELGNKKSRSKKAIGRKRLRSSVNNEKSMVATKMEVILEIVNIIKKYHTENNKKPQFKKNSIFDEQPEFSYSKGFINSFVKEVRKLSSEDSEGSLIFNHIAERVKEIPNFEKIKELKKLLNGADSTNIQNLKMNIKEKKNKKKLLKKVFFCTECLESFSNGQALGGHMSRKHPNKSEKYNRKKEIRENRVEFRVAIKQAKSLLLKNHGFDYEKLVENRDKRKIKSIIQLFSSEYKVILSDIKNQMNLNNLKNYTYLKKSRFYLKKKRGFRRCLKKIK